MKTTIELNNTPITIESIFAGTKNSLWDAKKEQHHIISVSVKLFIKIPFFSTDYTP